MSNHDLFPTFDELDADGAIREAAARVDPVTRGAFLRRAMAIIDVQQELFLTKWREIHG